MKNLLLLPVLVLLVGISCTHQRPVHYYVAEPDYNLRRKIDGARFKKKINPVGVAVVVGATVAGAFLGSQTDLFVFADKEGTRNSNSVANAALGGVVGFGVSSLGNYMVSGLGKEFSLQNKTDRERWLRQYDSKLIDLGHNNLAANQFYALPRKAENIFDVRKLSDGHDFLFAFPESQRRNEVFNKSLTFARRADLPQLISKCERCLRTTEAKRAYIRLSEGFGQFEEARVRYPDVANLEPKDTMELWAANSVRTTDDFLKFQKFAPQSKYTDLAFEKPFRSENLTDLMDLVKAFPEAKKRQAAVERCFELSSNFGEVLEVAKVFPEFKDLGAARGELLIARHEDVYDFAKTFPKYSRLGKYNFDPYIGDNPKNPNGRGVTAGSHGFYVGEFKNGKKHGQGKTTEEYGLHEGGYTNDEYEGEGYLKSINGAARSFSYKGNFSKGNQHGFGEFSGGPNFPCLVKKTEDIHYIGQWEKGGMTGAGKLKWKGGENWYEGGFLDGYFNGQGTLRISTGVQISGPWKDGDPNGFMTLKKWTLLGIFSAEASGTAYSWDELEAGPGRELSAAWAQEISPSSGSSGYSSSSSQKSTSCGEVTDDQPIKVCGVNVTMLRVKCGSGKSFNMYSWTKNLEKNCGHGIMSSFSGDGYYKRDMPSDSFLGKSESQAIKKGCKCD